MSHYGLLYKTINCLNNDKLTFTVILEINVHQMSILNLLDL